MQYRFGNYLLDAETRRMTFEGTAVHTPRRVFELLLFLVQNRHRAVDRDTLIRHIWKHDQVSHHQLAQVVLSARRLVGDNGSDSRAIRAISGYGYHWVAPVEECGGGTTDTELRPAVGTSTIDPEQLAPGRVDEPPLAQEPTVSRLTRTALVQRLPIRAMSVALLLLLLAAGSWEWLRTRFQHEGVAASQRAVAPASANSLDALGRLLREGDFDAVQKGLAQLPASLFESPDARLLAIQLDLVRGHWQEAEAKMQIAELRFTEMGDPISHSRLLALRVELLRRTERPPAEGVVPARRALEVLLNAPSEVSVPDEALADAYRVHGRALSNVGEWALALDALLRAREFYRRAGDRPSELDSEAAIARIWMRQGHVSQALQQLDRISRAYADMRAPAQEVSALNTMMRIQIGQMSWMAALATSDRTMEVLGRIPEFQRRSRSQYLRAWVLIELGRSRQAAALLEDPNVDTSQSPPYVAILHALASGNDALALDLAVSAFDMNDLVDSSNDVLFEHREGAMALWFKAANRLRAARGTVATMPTQFLPVLQAPESIAGLVARARWLAGSGDQSGALRAFEDAWQRARDDHQVLQARMILDAWTECLPTLRESVDRVDRLITELRALDPVAVDADYGTAVLALRLAEARGDANLVEQERFRAASLAGERKLHRIGH